MFHKITKQFSFYFLSLFGMNNSVFRFHQKMSKLEIYPIDPTLSPEEKILFIENVMNQIIADYEPLEFPETSPYPQLNAIKKVHEQSQIELHELMRELAEKLLIRINVRPKIFKILSLENFKGFKVKGNKKFFLIFLLNVCKKLYSLFYM